MNDLTHEVEFTEGEFLRTTEDEWMTYQNMDDLTEGYDY